MLAKIREDNARVREQIKSLGDSDGEEEDVSQLNQRLQAQHRRIELELFVSKNCNCLELNHSDIESRIETSKQNERKNAVTIDNRCRQQKKQNEYAHVKSEEAATQREIDELSLQANEISSQINEKTVL